MPSQASTQENPAAGVSPAAPWRVRAITVLPANRLAVTFRDGRQGVIDCSRVTTCTTPGIFAPLADPDYFAQVRLELGAPTWPNGPDLDPAWLHTLLKDTDFATLPF